MDNVKSKLEKIQKYYEQKTKDTMAKYNKDMDEITEDYELDKKIVEADLKVCWRI